MPKAPRVTVVAPQTTNVSKWDVALVRAALDAHEEGDFQLSAQLIDAMGRDGRISGDLATRANALVGKNGVKFEIQTSDHDKRRSSKLVSQVTRWWWDALPDSTQRRVLRSGVMAGTAYGPIRWVYKSGQYIPRVEVWSNENLWFDDQTDQYFTATADGRSVPVTPGDGNWFLYTPDGDRSWMAGAVRALGLAFVLRTFTERDWARFNERHGLPIIAIYEPSEASASDRATFFAKMRDLGSKGVVRLPQLSKDHGYDVEFKETVAGSWETFQGLLGKLEANISITLLGQNLSTEVKGGSFAAAQAHLRVRQDYLDADSQTLATALRDQVIKPWGRFNVSGWDDEMAPWPAWDTGLPEDKAATAKVIVDFADAIEKMDRIGLKVDVAALAERFDIPLLDENEPFEEADPQPVPPPPPPPPQEGDETPPQPDAETPPEEDEQPPGPDAKASTKAQRGAARRQAGFIEGQLYADAVTDHAARHGARLLRRDLEAVLALVDKTTDYEELRSGLIALYRDTSPEELSALVEAAMVLAGIGGAYAVYKDVPELESE